MIGTFQMSSGDVSQLAHFDRRSVHELGPKSSFNALEAYSMNGTHEGGAHSPKIA